VPDSGVNLLIHSTVDITCRFESTDPSGVEHYIGETGVGLGIDLSYNINKQMVFTVFAADTVNGSHKLAGKYGGAEHLSAPALAAAFNCWSVAVTRVFHCNLSLRAAQALAPVPALPTCFYKRNKQ